MVTIFQLLPYLQIARVSDSILDDPAIGGKRLPTEMVLAL